MKLFTLAAIGLCIVTGSICTPIQSPDDFTPADFSLQKRALIENINDMPQQEIDCDGYILPVNSILEALSQGVRWASTNPPTQKSTCTIRTVLSYSPQKTTSGDLNKNTSD